MKQRKNRMHGDCDTPHSYSSLQSMELGPIPIETEDDYGINSAYYIQYQNMFKTCNLYFNDNIGDARWLSMVFKI